MESVKIISGGYYEVMPGFGHDGSLIFKAATTCYKNEDKTKKSPDDFIRMLKKNGHTAMLEFMWVVMKFPKESYPDEMFQDVYVLSDYIKDVLGIDEKSFLRSYILPDSVVVCGNARAFFEQANMIISFNEMAGGVLRPIAVDMIVALRNIHPVLFDFDCCNGMTDTRAVILKEDDPLFSRYPFMNWQMVVFKDVSRGFTHEAVRHRVMSFAQTSTRYVDMSTTPVVFPMDEIQEDLQNLVISSLDTMAVVYSRLLDAKVSKNIARQLLPTGICADLCMAGDALSWDWVMNLRTASDAHWEIRTIMQKLLDDPGFLLNEAESPVV